MYKSISFLVIFLFLLSNLSAQNGWTRNAKGIYAQASVTNFASKDYYSVEGKLFNNGSVFHSNAFLLYAEYGITDRLTTVLDFPLLMVNSFETTEPLVGLGGLKLGLKYRLSKKIPLTFQIDADIPTSDGIQYTTTKEPNALGMFDRVNLPTSDGEFNFINTLAISQSTKSGKTWGSIYGTYNLRTKGYPDQYLYGAELGHLFFKKLYLIGKFRAQGKFTDENNTIGASFLYGEGTTFSTLGLTAMLKLKNKLRLVASYTGFVSLVEKRNLYVGPTFSFGVAYEKD